MKKEKFSFLILFIEIAAIIFLHSAKNHQPESNKMVSAKKSVAGSSYQLKVMPLTRVK